MIRSYDRYSFETSNEDKPLFPGGGPTKGQVIDYYERIAETMLPHLRDRPLVMRRCPDGIEDDCFYQKQIGRHFPDWVDRVTVRKRGSGGEQTLVVADKRATLAYLGQQAVIPIHAWLSRTDRLDHPDQLIIDLDPPGHDFEPVRSAARICRDLLRGLGLEPFLKTTGSKGLHVVVPLDRRESFDDVREFANRAMKLLAERHPEALTTEVRKSKRDNRVYLDVARNSYAQTAVAPYSLRAKPGAPVATPLEWRELGDRRIDSRSWTMRNIFRRLGQREDPWAGFARHAASLRNARERLDRISST
jgi:bifunctional non-homologous end joining protein LigD